MRRLILTFSDWFQVNGFPTLNIYKNGEKIEEFNGRRELADLEDFVNKHLASKDELWNAIFMFELHNHDFDHVFEK